MLWVGGHILLVGTDDLGLHVLYGAVHHLEEVVHDATGAFGGFSPGSSTRWPAPLLGLAVGALIVLVMSLHLPPAQGTVRAGDEQAHEPAAVHRTRRRGLAGESSAPGGSGATAVGRRQED